MAAFFRSFGTSSMAKRLVRYVLTRIDYFETEALELDKMNVAWGETSLLTWTDVGLKIEKIDKLLQLPPSIQIVKAKVLVLRVKIPVDFYSSPIFVEADGIDVKLRIVPPEELKASRRGASKQKGNRKAAEKVNDESVPNTSDIVQSFLETQPRKEKEELQAALDAETQDLAASVTSSEEGSEDDYPLGTGQPLSLPAFLQSFTDGLVDRLQCAIRGITCHLDVEVSIEPSSATTEVVTFQLAIDELDVEGVTTAKLRDDGAGKPLESVHKPGKKYFELRDVRACLISEANFFSSLSRSPSMPTSAGANSPVATNRQPLSREPTAMSRAFPQFDASLADSGELSESQYHPLMDSEDAFNIPYDMSSSNSDPEENDELRSNPSTPRAGTPRAGERAIPRDDPVQSTLVPQRDLWTEPLRPTARSEPTLEHLGQWSGPPLESSQMSFGSNDDLPEMSDGGPSPSSSQDLAQSHLFSHEEAESMYLSAFSHATSSQMPQSMPGAWDTEPLLAGSPTSQRSHHQSQIQTGAEPVAADQQEPLVIRQPSPTESRPLIDNLQEAIHSPDSESEHSNSPEASIHNGPLPVEDALADNTAAEEAATPKGPTRLAKELVNAKAFHLWIPIKSDDKPSSVPVDTHMTPQRSLYRSVAPNIPGAFSVHAGAQSTSSVMGHSFQPAQETQTPKEPVDRSIEVVLSRLEINFDLPIAFLLTTVLSRILGALSEPTGQSKPGQSKPDTTSASTSSPFIFKLIAEKISVHFLESLVGVADTPERILGSRVPAFGSDALLTATLQNLTVNLSKSQSSTTTSLDVGKFKFGYANDDIISFDQRIQMRSSIRDAFPSSGSDVSLAITQTPDSTRCEVKTLPLHVKLDLPRLDETFTWFGGLSSFLSLNSSMVSNTSTPPQSSIKSPRKSRGVKFDTPIRPDDTSAHAENKVNMRIGGFRLDLVGKECSISLDTSAVKLVNREEGLGVGISKVQLLGPYIRNSGADPPINAMITNTRFEFSSGPKNADLERLLELITPSKYKFDLTDDEIMVDTLLRQRRKGSVLRVYFDSIDIDLSRVQQLQVLSSLGEDFARLSTVTKYLPEDDRPGLLTLALARNINVSASIDKKIGVVRASLRDLEVGHITMPSLVALGLGSVSIGRNHNEQLVSTVVPTSDKIGQGPVLTMRMIGDEMEPVVKLRMRHLDIEYRVPTIMDLLDLGEDTTPQEFEASLAASIANLGDHAQTAMTGKPKTSTAVSEKKEARATRVDIVFRDCLLGLNPLGLTSKLAIVLSDARLEIALPKGDDINALARFNKTSILLIDDISVLDSKSPSASKRRPSNTATPQIIELCQQGYVDICYMSSAKVTVQVGTNEDDGSKWVDVEFRDDLLVLETCADSTQTLISLANALAPPTPPKREIKYRTKVIPMQDMLSSISADAFGRAEGAYNIEDDFLDQVLEAEDSFDSEDSDSSPLGYDSHFFDPSAESQLIDPADSILSERTTGQETNDGVLLTNFNSQPEDPDDDSDLDIQDNYFTSGPAIEGTAHRWNSTKNTYDQSSPKFSRSPLTVRVRDVHFIWNLFDGYDWNHTRDVISKAVYDIEATANERQSRQDRARVGTDMEIVEEETVIGDFLFNSIYIGIPANRDPTELAHAINQDLNDNATETESIATTATIMTHNRQHSRQGSTYRGGKRLRLNRSKRHKITFELRGINVDLVTFSSGETQSTIDVRVKDLEVFDHVPTSTWKKFATYNQDAGEREMGASMVHLEILNVKPQPDLAASEIVLKASVLPLRLHVDQDALDFITRFFEFKDDTKPIHTSPSDIPFIQRAEIMDIPVTLDFKPKRVDYAGLRSGHTTEFMNFVVLDESRLVLRRTIVYGASGFDRLGKTLNDIWTPDVKRNQLPGVLAGLAPVRSLVNVGSGFKDLIEIPIKEYKKDGRIVRSIGKGAAAFVKSTGTELVKLGAKMAVGTQYALQGAEEILVQQPSSHDVGGWEDEDTDSEEQKQISLYANQPTGVVQGLRGAYSSLARDLNAARDAIIAVPAEIMESENAQGAAKAVLRRAPTIIFRPLIGSSKAIGQTLMGATNSLDPNNERRISEKYKRH
ncbi:hypothetical protein F5Y18DRAFT_18246 [Xylariaceae sp. FL1019]|nr:hypothetical protein F5Y18DRAFT_18246 [Xylariaceae sp. FL1019]